MAVVQAPRTPVRFAPSVLLFGGGTILAPVPDAGVFSALTLRGVTGNASVDPASSTVMQSLSQSPTDPAFVQDPYPFYERARALGPVFFWQEYGLAGCVDHALVNRLLRDRRLGREVPAEKKVPPPDHLATFYALERHSLLEIEPPDHTRLRSLVMRAFTSRAIAALAPMIDEMAHALIDAFPAEGSFDLLAAFCEPIPVRTICRLLGVPEEMAPRLLSWSHAMVAMYQAGRTRAREEAAEAAARDFAAFVRDLVAERRRRPTEDLIGRLVTAESEGRRLTTDELVTTVILLLNAGHEATVHAFGNGIKALIEHGFWTEATFADEAATGRAVEEILRFDPPLHLFTRHVHEPLEIGGHPFARGDEIGLLLAAAGRDPAVWEAPARFDPSRPVRPHLAFGAGIHFCIGAPLARLELMRALPILQRRCPDLALAGRPRYAMRYHFRGLEELMVCRR